MRTDTVPDFLYIGTSKAGSTWLFNALAVCPDVWLASNKGLYFFDAHYERGVDWYRQQFQDAEGRAVGEFSHSYLSSPEAPPRIAAYSPSMRLLVCLREPVDRAFSDYLDLVKNNGYTGSFTDAVVQHPRLLDRGRYATHLSRYLEHFPMSQIHVGLFDDLKTGAQAYADEVYDFLGLDRLMLSEGDLKARMPAGRPRNAAVVGLAKRASKGAASLGLRRWRSRIKRSTVVRSALYKQYRDDKPRLDPSVRDELRAGFADEVARLDHLLGRPVSQTWGYDPAEVS
ncbi:sulfotransferase domain-containing protein [Nocardioides cynanchi]|uniref:sulfotransferase domain-containing protein n=1 Tax=Nocardioides cynanchi TaxID=2558918 RepID=UPI001247B611|nr:sulfotransferase domain-containing protein [Nocardioides cynanchi]